MGDLGCLLDRVWNHLSGKATPMVDFLLDSWQVEDPPYM